MQLGLLDVVGSVRYLYLTVKWSDSGLKSRELKFGLASTFVGLLYGHIYRVG